MPPSPCPSPATWTSKPSSTPPAGAGADALHPGYGFLSENPDLAAACAAAGIVFVGPPPEAMRLLGDKRRARALARSLEVPVLAGYEGPDAEDAPSSPPRRRSGSPSW